MVFSPDGTTLLTGDGAGNAYLWSAATGRKIAELANPGDSGEVLSVALSPDGSLAAVGYRDGSTSIWNVSTGARLGIIPGPARDGEVNWLAFSPSGSLLAVGQRNGSTYLWQVSANGAATGVGTLRDPASNEGIWAVAFSPDGSMLATTDYAGNVDIWRVSNPAAPPAESFATPDGMLGTAVAFSPDGHSLAVGTGNQNGTAAGTTYVWPLGGGSPASFVEPETVWGLAFVGNGKLALADDDGTTYLVNLRTSQQVTLSDPASGPYGVGAVAVSPDDATLATGDTNGTTYLWQIG